MTPNDFGSLAAAIAAANSVSMETASDWLVLIGDTPEFTSAIRHSPPVRSRARNHFYTDVSLESRVSRSAAVCARMSPYRRYTLSSPVSALASNLVTPSKLSASAAHSFGVARASASNSPPAPLAINLAASSTASA